MGIKQYTVEKLKSEINLMGWILVILGLAILYIALNMVSSPSVRNGDLIVLTAMIAGSSSAYLRRNKMIKELQARE